MKPECGCDPSCYPPDRATCPRTDDGGDRADAKETRFERVTHVVEPRLRVGLFGGTDIGADRDGSGLVELRTDPGHDPDEHNPVCVRAITRWAAAGSSARRSRFTCRASERD